MFFPAGSAVKNPPVMQETWIQSLGWEDPLEKEMAGYPFQYSWASLEAQTVKNPPEKQETWVHSLGWEDSLEKRTVTTPVVVLPGEFHEQRILAGPSPWGCKESDTTE